MIRVCKRPIEMRLKALALTSLSMLAFAINSLLCRMALTQTDIDAASFFNIRLTSGALILRLIVITAKLATWPR